MNRSAVIALGALVVLGGVFFATQEEQVSVGVQTLSFKDFDGSAIRQVEIKGKNAARLSQKDGQWQIAVADGAKQVPADGQAVEKVLEEVGKVRSSFMVSQRKEAHGDYEVTAETGTEVILSSEKGQAVSLVIGKRTAKGGNYLRESGSDKVFSASTRLASLVSKKTIDWRGRGLWNLKKEEITRVLLKPVEQAGFALVLEGEGPQSQIKLAEDVKTAPGFRFGVSEAKRLVDALPSLRAVAFVDEPKKDDEMGFGGAHTQVVVEKKEGKSLTLHIGSENDKNQVYVKVADKEQVYLLTKSSVQKFKGGLDALRAMDLVAFDDKQVTKLEIISGQNKTVVEKNAGAWAITSPKKLPDAFEFDPATVVRQLSSLKNTKAASFVGLENQVGFGFKKPSLEVRVQQADGQQAALIFGRDLTEGDAQTYVKSPIDGGTYLVRSFQKTRFERGVDLFKKVAPPPMNFNQAQGFNSLPPDVRKSLEEQMRKQNL